MKLEVGMFVRTICGIAKIESFEAMGEQINLDKDIMFVNMDIYRNCCTKSQITKASFNILELIEEGTMLMAKK